MKAATKESRRLLETVKSTTDLLNLLTPNFKRKVLATFPFIESQNLPKAYQLITMVRASLFQNKIKHIDTSIKGFWI